MTPNRTFVSGIEDAMILITKVTIELPTNKVERMKVMILALSIMFGGIALLASNSPDQKTYAAGIQVLMERGPAIEK